MLLSLLFFSYLRKLYPDGPALPVRWMAPECLDDLTVWTLQSDMWSLGVVLWEIFTFAKQPYASIPNNQVSEAVHKGERLTASPDCASAPDALCVGIPRGRIEGYMSSIETLQCSMFVTFKVQQHHACVSSCMYVSWSYSCLL